MGSIPDDEPGKVSAAHKAFLQGGLGTLLDLCSDKIEGGSIELAYDMWLPWSLSEPREHELVGEFGTSPTNTSYHHDHGQAMS
jgi:hypothetical protein